MHGRRPADYANGECVVIAPPAADHLYRERETNPPAIGRRKSMDTANAASQVFGHPPIQPLRWLLGRTLQKI